MCKQDKDTETVWATPKDKKLIYAKMAQVMREIGHISKDQKNTFDGYQFRGIDDVMNALHAPLARAGIIIIPEVLDRQETQGKTSKGTDMVKVVLRVKYNFICEDGSGLYCLVYGEANDRSDKATNKAMAAAYKYAVLQVFSIPVKELEDADKVSLETPKVTHVHDTPKVHKATLNTDDIPAFDASEPLPDFTKKPELVDDTLATDRELKNMAQLAKTKGYAVEDLKTLVKDLTKKTKSKELTSKECQFVKNFVMDNPPEIMEKIHKEITNDER